jgi:hypothetical protein
MKKTATSKSRTRRRTALKAPTKASPKRKRVERLSPSEQRLVKRIKASVCSTDPNRTVLDCVKDLASWLKDAGGPEQLLALMEKAKKLGYSS